MTLKKPLCLYNGLPSELKTGDSLDVRTPNPNLLVNGDMQIAQDWTAYSSIPSGSYPCDNWYYYSNTGAVVDYNLNSGMVFDKFKNYMSLTSSTSSTPTSSGLTYICTFIEGLDFRQLYGQKTTLSFKIYSTITGVMSILVQNAAGDRSYIAAVSLSAGWNNCAVLVPLDILTGIWSLDNTRGASISFILQAGTGLLTTSTDTWLTSASYKASSSQSNFLVSSNSGVAITDVKWETGTAQTDFISRDFETELRKCQRYYFNSAYNINGYVNRRYIGAFHTTTGNTTHAVGFFNFPVTMRTTPAATVEGVYVWNTNTVLTGVTIAANTWIHPWGFEHLGRAAGWTSGQWVTPYNVKANTRL